jgi:hypothetical protein
MNKKREFCSTKLFLYLSWQAVPIADTHLNWSDFKSCFIASFAGKMVPGIEQLTVQFCQETDRSLILSGDKNDT